MRRAVLVLAGTAAGLAALLSYKTHSPAEAAAASTPAMPPPAAPSASPSAVGTGATSVSTPAGSTRGGKATPKSTASAGASGKASGGTSTASRTVTGSVANTQYGPMQVKVTLTGTRITAVAVVQQTDDGSMSEQIDSFAIPKLTSETLAAQSARIDAVSGASYTSSGYIQSLQSALDQANV
jgi:uncharacterized protein with FMN-binding domain